MQHLTLAIDVMGGDNGPLSTIPAVIKAVKQSENLTLILCGDQQQIEQHLKRNNCPEHIRLQIVHCEQSVDMNERPSHALRNKRDSSMRKAIELVERGEAQACVSAGNTGALMAMALTVLKPLTGIERPALISSLPSKGKGKVYLLDLGANLNCSSDILFQYAVMGSVMAEQVEQINNPRVALLNVGEEQVKGNDQVKQAAQLLADCSEINYVGFIEGNDIFHDKADVVVCDGFVGNVALKACEGFSKLVLNEARRAFSKNWFAKLIARLALPLMKNLYSRMNPDQYNGASLIGLRGIVVKSHGNASADAFRYAILEAEREVQRQVPNKIKNKIENLL